MQAQLEIGFVFCNRFLQKNWSFFLKKSCLFSKPYLLLNYWKIVQLLFIMARTMQWFSNTSDGINNATRPDFMPDFKAVKFIFAHKKLDWLHAT